jgi:serine/threonine protein kinase
MEPDGATLGNTMVRLGLITPEQLQDGLDETGTAKPSGDELLRVLERKGYVTPWQSSKVLKGDSTGFSLGGYRILYKIASGSFGRVFRGEDPNTGRSVAIKVLRRRWSEDQQHIDLFIREGKVGMNMKHPSIVEVLAMSHDQPSGQYYIVMEFIEGGNVREILQIRKQLTPAESLRIIENCASALVYAYSKGVTHRDIKLTNVLVSSSGEAKLVDFGLAQIFQKMGGEQLDKVERTVDYAGLERATDVSFGDVRSDIYFLGCILYECLTGRAPLLTSRDKYARMRKDRFQNVPPISPSELKAPPSVFHLVETMMSLDPQKRFQTPSQLLEAIHKAQADVEGKAVGPRKKSDAPRAIFIVEADERLQDALREKFKSIGYRVFLAADPNRAVDRFRQQPFDVLLIDAGSTGEPGLFTFDFILKEAKERRTPCVGVLILSEEQASWTSRVMAEKHAAVLVRPVGLKKIQRTLEELLKERDEG